MGKWNGEQVRRLNTDSQIWTLQYGIWRRRTKKTVCNTGICGSWWVAGEKNWSFRIWLFHILQHSNDRNIAFSKIRIKHKHRARPEIEPGINNNKSAEEDEKVIYQNWNWSKCRIGNKQKQTVLRFQDFTGSELGRKIFSSEFRVTCLCQVKA